MHWILNIFGSTKTESKFINHKVKENEPEKRVPHLNFGFHPESSCMPSSYWGKNTWRKKGFRRRWINCLVNIVASRMPSNFGVRSINDKTNITLPLSKAEENGCYKCELWSVTAAAPRCQIQIDWSKGEVVVSCSHMILPFLNAAAEMILKVAWIFVQSILMLC